MRVTSPAVKTAEPAVPVAFAPPPVWAALRTPGQPLDPPVRREFEQRFGHDFGRVRVHWDQSSADALGAAAYTVGRHIVFAPDCFHPDTPAGRLLLAHELTHVRQQHAAPDPLAAPAPLPVGGAETRHERDAEDAAVAVLWGGPVPTPLPTGQLVVQRGWRDFYERAKTKSEQLADRATAVAASAQQAVTESAGRLNKTVSEAGTGVGLKVEVMKQAAGQAQTVVATRASNAVAAGKQAVATAAGSAVAGARRHASIAAANVSAAKQKVAAAGQQALAGAKQSSVDTAFNRIGQLKGAVIQVTDAVDTTVWALGQADEAYRKHVGIQLVRAGRSLARTAGIPQRQSEAEAEAIYLTEYRLPDKPGVSEWTAGKFDLGADKLREAAGVKPAEFGAGLTSYEVGEIEGAVATQVGLALVGVAEVKLVLTGLSVVGALRGIVEACGAEGPFYKKAEFWASALGLAASLIGLKATRAGNKLIQYAVTAIMAGDQAKNVVLAGMALHQAYNMKGDPKERERKIVQSSQQLLGVLAQFVVSLVKGAGSKKTPGRRSEEPAAAKPPTGEPTPTTATVPDAATPVAMVPRPAPAAVRPESVPLVPTAAPRPAKLPRPVAPTVERVADVQREAARLKAEARAIEPTPPPAPEPAGIRPTPEQPTAHPEPVAVATKPTPTEPVGTRPPEVSAPFPEPHGPKSEDRVVTPKPAAAAQIPARESIAPADRASLRADRSEIQIPRALPHEGSKKLDPRLPHEPPPEQLKAKEFARHSEERKVAQRELAAERSKPPSTDSAREPAEVYAETVTSGEVTSRTESPRTVGEPTHPAADGEAVHAAGKSAPTKAAKSGADVIPITRPTKRSGRRPELKPVERPPTDIAAARGRREVASRPMTPDTEPASAARPVVEEVPMAMAVGDRPRLIEAPRAASEQPSLTVVASAGGGGKNKSGTPAPATRGTTRSSGSGTAGGGKGGGPRRTTRSGRGGGARSTSHEQPLQELLKSLTPEERRWVEVNLEFLEAARAGGNGHPLPEGTSPATTQRAAPTGSHQHHVLVQEQRTWFEDRGFKGKNNIDRHTVTLERAIHEATHGGGDKRLARKEKLRFDYNLKLMDRLTDAERAKQGRLKDPDAMLTPQEIWPIVYQVMDEFKLPHGPKDFKPYRGRRSR